MFMFNTLENQQGFYVQVPVQADGRPAVFPGGARARRGRGPTHRPRPTEEAQQTQRYQRYSEQSKGRLPRL